VVIGILVDRIPVSEMIEPDGTGVVGKVDFEADAPAQARRYFDESPTKRAYTWARALGELATALHTIFSNPAVNPTAPTGTMTSGPANWRLKESLGWTPAHFVPHCHARTRPR
jgi:hypothetical protein